MNIIFRRHFWLILIFLLITGTFLAIGTTRIISYNFGETNDIEIKDKNYDNAISLFDTSKIHQITIGLDETNYDLMVKTYQEIGEKEYYRTYITIDGVTIPDVGIRLKGNLTLRQTLGGNGNGQARGGPEGENGDRKMGGMFDLENIDLENLHLPPNLELPANWDSLSDPDKITTLQDLFANMMPGGQNRENKSGEMGGMMGGTDSTNPPYLIKFDEFIDGQSYQNFSEIAVRLGSDKSLLGEPVAFAIHKSVGQIVPESSYAVIDIATNETSLYVITEHPSKKYIEKYFPDEDGILYKAGNFVGFDYLGEDPSLYSEKFEQKTNKGDDDMSQLIDFMQFVSESSDSDFETNLGNWLDLESFIKMMALDNLLQNQDSFVGMGSNYYLFYSKTNEIFTMLSWDQNLAMGGMGNMGGGNKSEKDNTDSQQNQQAAMDEWLKEGGFGTGTTTNSDRKMGGGRNSTNTLKTKFMANPKFLAMYESTYATLKTEIFDQGLGSKIVDQFALPFLEYNSQANLLDQAEYQTQTNSKKSFFTSNS